MRELILTGKNMNYEKLFFGIKQIIKLSICTCLDSKNEESRRCIDLVSERTAKEILLIMDHVIKAVHTKIRVKAYSDVQIVDTYNLI